MYIKKKIEGTFSRPGSTPPQRSRQIPHGCSEMPRSSCRSDSHLVSGNIPYEPSHGHYTSGNAEITVGNPRRDHEPLHLMVDLYSADRVEDVGNVAAGLGIDLLFIGALKLLCRSLFDRYCADNPMADIDKPCAVPFQIEGLERISAGVFQRAGMVYTEGSDDGHEERDAIGE
jgi:hypothetical protein